MRARRRLLDSDFKAGLALLIFPLVYAGVPIGLAIGSQPAPRLDPKGQPYPTLMVEGIAYFVVFSLMALLGHLPVFVAFRWRHPTWPIRALAGLQVLSALGSLAAFRFVEPPLGLFVVPALVTLGVYGIAALIVRRNLAS